MTWIQHRVAFVVWLLLFSSPRLASAQSASAQLVGRIADLRDSMIPGAKITLASQSTGLQRTTVSNRDGYYVIPLLPPAVYSITVQRAGFRPISLTGIALSVNQIARQDIVLSVGVVSTTIDVAANVDMLQSDSSELGTVIGGDVIGSLPLKGRNFTQLLTLSTGASPINTSQSGALNLDDGSTVALPDSSFSNPALNGQINRSAIFLLDGVINTDFRGTTYTIMPNVDLIQEFKVQTHNDRAEFGSVAGATINLVSRSGTNIVHGSAYEFVRNNAFDARDTFFDAQRHGPAPFRQNQFGATASGPVVKNKTFLSGGYEGWRHAKPSGLRLRTPTEEEIAGDFSASVIGRDIYDPLTTRKDPANPTLFTRGPFPGNTIPSARLDPMTVGFIKNYFPKPNYLDPSFNVIVNHPQRNMNDSWQVKADHQIQQKASLWARYSAMNVTQITPQSDIQDRLWTMDARNFGAGAVYTIGHSAMLDLRGGYSARPFVLTSHHRAGLETAKALGLANLDKFGGVMFNLLTPWQSAGFFGSQPRDNPVSSLSASLSMSHGSHDLKAGFQYIDVRRYQTSPELNYWFDDAVTADPQKLGTTGASLASALLGMPQSYTGKTAELSRADFSIPTWAAYIQDAWKLKTHVTLTLGLRFDRVNHVDLREGMNNGPNLATGNWEIGGGTMPPPCNSATSVPCIPGNGFSDVPFAEHIVLAADPDRWRRQNLGSFGPRAGIGWRLAKGLVLRAGYGLLYDTLPGQSQLYQNGLGSWPYSAGLSSTANAIGDTPVFFREQQGAAFKALPAASPWSSVDWFSAPGRQDAYSHQWNVEIQRQVTDNLMASLAYVGSTNRRTEVGGLANVAITTAPGNRDTVNSRKPYPWMGTFFYDDSIGSSSYHSMQFKLQRRWAAGFQALLAYTWSKTMDSGSSGYFGAENGAGGSSALQNLNDLKGSRSVSSYDIPHFLSVSATWDLPVGKGRHLLARGFASGLFDNWQMNVILQARSGQPYNLTVAGDVANIGNNVSWWNYARPNLVGDPRLTQPTADRFFNTAAFAIPRYSYGNFGRNVLRTAAASGVDAALTRAFLVRHDPPQRLQLRWEVFNTMNVMNWGAPGTTIGQPDAGRVTSLAIPPRIMQFGLRFSF